MASRTRATIPLLWLLLVACGGGGAPPPVERLDGQPRAAWATTPVAAYGRLRVCGNRICSAAGTPVQLRGMSLFWSNTGWGGERFYNASAVGNLVDGWNATVIRVAVGVEGEGGYRESSTSAAANMARARAVIDAAIARGIYVLVDWHSHNLFQADAQAFFRELATAYASTPNIIWEPFNEPTSQSWASLKAYHQAVISTIRAAGSQNLVVLGNPNWSQDVDVAAADPVSDANTAYSLHFYAGSHGQWLRDKGNRALSRGVAIFVTEYGTCDASGDGGFNAGESSNWTSWMDANKISSANWSLNDKKETASALVFGASGTGPWPSDQLTQSGAWVKPYVQAGYDGSSSPTTFALSVTRTGAGTVTSSPAGISCGTSCSASFASGASVTLTATPDSGGRFTGWSGACSGTGATCTVTLSAAQAVTATFEGSGTGTAPCSGAVTLTSGSSGNFGSTAAACYRTTATVNGWGCSNTDGRTVTVNGTATTCGKLPLPTRWSDGYNYFAFSAGTYPWASFYFW